MCNPGFVVTEDMKDCVGQYHNTIFLTTGGIVVVCLTHATPLPSDRDKRFVTTRRRGYKGNKNLPNIETNRVFTLKLKQCRVQMSVCLTPPFNVESFVD